MVKSMGKNQEAHKLPNMPRISIKKAPDTTKICPVCEKRIIEGLYHIAIQIIHKREEKLDYHKSDTYNAGVVYIHRDCIEEMDNIISKCKRLIRKDIKQNLQEVCADQI